MGRRAHPWYRASHRAWYTRLDGQMVRLGETEREAWSEFHRLMATRGQGPVRTRVTVEELVRP